MAEVDDIIQEPSEAEKRIKSLSGKLKEEAEAKAAAEKAKADADTKAAEAEKRADFAEGFADVLSQNPAAKEFKQQIQEKVMGGYSMEDATFAVLGKAGKLGQSVPEPISPAGGSASIAPPDKPNKAVGQMTQEERRQALLEAEQRGDISFT